MKVRYCPNCKKDVGKKLTVGQVVLMVALYSAIIPGIIYSITHTRKCPICAAPTVKIENKK